MGMTREDVISWLEYLSDDARSKADGLVPTNIEIACGMAIDALKAQEPRVMTWNEVKKKIGSGEYVFTECEKEGQWMRYGDARLSVDQGDSCRIAFLISRRRDDPYVRWWWISYRNYNKTWRCWTSRPTEEEMEATPWNAQK